MSTRIALVYIAGPYRSPDPEVVGDNVDAAEALGEAIVRSGVPALPVVPHSIGYRYGHLAPADVDEDYWLPATLALMVRCDAVLLTSGWATSVGATAERARALELGMPVFDNVYACIEWAEGRAR